jgi:hypothetical protein
MSQTKAGAAKQRETIYARYGKDYFAEVGRLGGLKKVPKGFALSGKAAEAGKIGGQRSRRGKANATA